MKKLLKESLKELQDTSLNDLKVYMEKSLKVSLKSSCMRLWRNSWISLKHFLEKNPKLVSEKSLKQCQGESFNEYLRSSQRIPKKRPWTFLDNPWTILSSNYRKKNLQGFVRHFGWFGFTGDLSSFKLLDLIGFVVYFDELSVRISFGYLKVFLGRRDDGIVHRIVQGIALSLVGWDAEQAGRSA